MAQVLEYVGLFLAVAMVLIGLALILRKPKPSAVPEPSVLEVDGKSLQPIVPRHLRQLPSDNAATTPVVTPDTNTAQPQPTTQVTKPSSAVTDSNSDAQLDLVLAQLEQQASDNPTPSIVRANVPTENVDDLQPDSEPTSMPRVDDLAHSEKVALSDWQGESDILDAHINEQNRHDEESALATAKHFVALYLYPSPSRALSGERVLRMLLKYGLRFGEMSCFHRYQDPEQVSELMFSVLRINEDGTPSGFDLETLPSEEVKGLAMFLALPNAHAVQGFDMMASLSILMAREIDGTLYDEQSLEFTAQLREHWRHYVIEYKA